jgi:hypothetical protein
MPLDRNAVLNLLARMLKGGPLDRLPKRRADLEVLLALGTARFVPDRIYAEQTINERLIQWIDEFTEQAFLDHVTLRRYMVDLRFLLRDAAGTTYRANFAKVDGIIARDARSIDVGDVMVSLARARDTRKQARAGC